MHKKPGRPFRKPDKKKPRQKPEGIRKFTSENGAKLKVLGKKGKRAIVTLASGTTFTFIVKRINVAGTYKMALRREYVPDTPEKSGEFKKITTSELILLQNEFPVLRQFGWPL